MKRRGNRRSPSNARYLSERRWVKNRIKRLAKHIKSHKNDECAVKVLKKAI